jgi:predicted Zn-dependent protease
VRSIFGAKQATVTTNDQTDEGLERAVRQSETVAKLAPDDPEIMPLLEPQQYAESRTFHETTASLLPESRARSAGLAITAAKSGAVLKAAGFITTASRIVAIGNSKGLFAYAPSTSANYTATVRTADGTGSGWAGADNPDWSRIDARRVSEAAITKARLSRNPQPLDAGRYTVILEPQAVADLVQLLLYSMDARSADEGRSAFSKEGGGTKIGMKLMDEQVTIVSDPLDAQLGGTPFDGEGLPLKRRVWVQQGELRNLIYGRFWARKQGKEPTGFPNTLKMIGTDTSRDELIASTPRGVLVTRFWYLRQVDPRTVLYTGLTRDGTFLIENGKIARAVKNFRFNESPLLMLDRLEGIGQAVRVAGTESGGNVVVPALKIREFNFTSTSDAV